MASRFLHWLLVDEEDGGVRFAKTVEAAAAIRQVGDLLTRVVLGETITAEEWKVARDAANAYTNLYATDAATDYAADAAAYGTDFGEEPLDYVADTAIAAFIAVEVDEDFVCGAARTKQAAKWLQLLREAPVPV